MASVENLEFTDPEVLEAAYQERLSELQDQLSGYRES